MNTVTATAFGWLWDDLGRRTAAYNAALESDGLPGRLQRESLRMGLDTETAEAADWLKIADEFALGPP